MFKVVVWIQAPYWPERAETRTARSRKEARRKALSICQQETFWKHVEITQLGKVKESWGR